MATPKIPSAKSLGIKANPVTITHTIKEHGYDLREGMEMKVTRIYERNGETQLEGYVDGRNKKEEVPAIWTNVDFE